MAAGVVVWEWQNEYGSWRPYSPQISAFLETNKQSPVPLHLGSVDPMLYLYQIDVQNSYQTRQGTGTQRPIRRAVQPSSSPLAKGITWQWEGDALGSWCDFDIEIINYLDECFVKGQAFIDLSKSKFFLPYHIDLKAMTQTRIETGRVRNIQRVFTTVSYPQDMSVSSSAGVKRQSGGNTGKGVSGKRLRSATQSSNVGTQGFVSSVGASSSSVLNNNSVSQQTNSAFTTTSSSLSANNIGPHNLPPASLYNHTQQGPITRRRYILSQTARGLQTQSPANQSVPVTMSSAFSAIPSQTASVAQTGPPLLTFTSIAGFQPGVFSNQGTSNLGPVPMYGGNPMPGSMFNVQPTSTSSSSIPTHFLHGNLNPSQLFSGGRLGRVRPSQQGACGSSSQQSSFASTSSSQLPRYDRIPNFAPKSSKRSSKTNTSSQAEDILHNYVKSLTSPPADEDCCICCEKLIEASGHGTGSPEDQIVYKLDKCKHMFHKLCLTAMYDSGSKDGHLVCPTCKKIYGEKMGNCPAGDMEYKIIDHNLAGYEGHRTIQIMYNISSGTQGPEHPHPGKRYTARGFPRIGYLPDCDKGRKVLQLLIIAWKKRLTFTIGRSTTTSEDNTVTWNEIHHKTELGSNYSGHGYPDPKYLDNVLHELEVHGITEKDLPSG